MAFTVFTPTDADGSFIEQAARQAVANWMQSSTTSTPVAYATWGIMLAANTLSSLSRFGKNNLAGVMTSIASNKVMYEIQKILFEPNFQGIVLHSASESTSRQTDVSDEVVIVQDGYYKEHNIDNAVPKLKEWTYDAYLVAQDYLGIDAGLLIKPTLDIQLQLLDYMAASRQPGWLKDTHSRFHKVMITSLTTEKTPNAMNGVHIQISFKEYKVLKTSSALFAKVTAKVQGD